MGCFSVFLNEFLKIIVSFEFQKKTYCLTSEDLENITNQLNYGFWSLSKLHIHGQNECMDYSFFIIQNVSIYNK